MRAEPPRQVGNGDRLATPRVALRWGIAQHPPCPLEDAGMALAKSRGEPALQYGVGHLCYAGLADRSAREL